MSMQSLCNTLVSKKQLSKEESPSASGTAKSSTTYHRKGFGLKETVEVELKKVYESDLIQKLREAE